MKVDLTEREVRVLQGWLADALATERELGSEESTDWLDLLEGLERKLKPAARGNQESRGE